MPRTQASRKIVSPIPAKSAALSFVPKVVTAKSFIHGGVKSMKVEPRAITGVARAVKKAPTSSATASTTAAETTPARAARTVGPDGRRRRFRGVVVVPGCGLLGVVIPDVRSRGAGGLSRAGGTGWSAPVRPADRPDGRHSLGPCRVHKVPLGTVKVLVIGPGGREHAIVRSLLADPNVSEVHAAPGNAGIGKLVPTYAIDAGDPDAVAALATRLAVDLVVVGPEAPLAAGVSDAVREAGIPVFGPSKAAAQLEASKAFAKE